MNKGTINYNWFLLERIGLVGAPGLPKIIDQILKGVSPLVCVDGQGLAPHTGGDLVDLLVLERLPQVVGDVEHDALEEKTVPNNSIKQRPSMK